MDVSRISVLEKVKLYMDLLDFKVHKVGDNVLITEKPPDLTDDNELNKLLAAGYFKRIVHRGTIKPHFKYVATASLPAAGASFSLENVTTPDWEDWLNPSTNTFLDVILGFASDKYTQWKVRHVGREQGWIKSTIDTDEKYTTGDILKLVCTRMAKPGNYSPNFVLYNYSQQSLLAAQAQLLWGWKYAVVTIPEARGIPRVFTPITVADVESA